ncbi:MAG: NADH-quinone oxidoreductase subunit N [Deltaproteobacteria bacterium]|nr:NADH-quinone oxidoreductase subunit N [Deltaproteobacteria bacterium]
METNIQNLLNILVGGITIWILCAGALLCLLIDALWPRKMSVPVYTIGILTLIVTLCSAWYQWLQPDLPAAQDLLVIDLHTLFFITLVVLVGILTILNALGYMQLHNDLTAEFCSLIIFSIIGMVFFFSSDHLLINFIGLETMSLSIYVLVGSHKKNFKSNEAAIKYFIIGGVASAIFLYGVAMFYGAYGTLKISELAMALPTQGLDYLPKTAVAFILTGIFFKLAVVPFHFWAPDVYEGAPSPVTGFMATGVKIASFGFAIRIFIGINVLDMPQIQNLLVVVVVATFIVGNLLAIVQDDVKRMLAYSSVSHAGFVLFGMLAGFREGRYEPFSSHTVMFYLLGYLLMTLGAFAILSLMIRKRSEATHYTDLEGLGHSKPLLAGLFTLFMFSMVGMPGTVGFAAKYSVISLAVQNGHIGLAILAVVMSIVSAFYYLRPSVTMFFKKGAGGCPVIQEIPFTSSASITFCAFTVIYLGLNPDAFIKLAKIAAF